MDVLTIKLKKASVNEVNLIGELAHLIWWQYYPAIISHAQITYMLQKLYQPSSLIEQMQTQQHCFYLIQNKEEAIGFLSVSEVEKQHWFIHKFYIHQQQAATGIGTQVFNTLLDTLLPQTLQLTVNRQNYKSINFYFKNGFKIEKVANFDIGNGFVMEDFVMTWKKK